MTRSALPSFAARWLPLGVLVACGLRDPGPLGARASDTGGPDSGSGELGLEDGVSAPAPARRLSQTEYARTVSSLLGVALEPGLVLADPERHGFADTTTTAVGALGADRYLRAAEQATAALGRAAPACAPGTGCMEALLADLGRRAFRRDLTDAERTVFLDLFADLAARETPAQATAGVLEALLQSPQFLYRLEPGLPPEDGVVALTGEEIATRYAFFLWGEGPDAALLDAAAAGRLDTPEGREAVLAVLLADPRARTGFSDFVEQWSGSRHVQDQQRDAVLFPEWNAALAAAQRAETRDFAAHVAFEGAGTLDALLTASYTVVSPLGAEVYGVGSHPGGVLVLDPEERAGLLTQPAVLAAHAHDNQTSVTLRGRLVREQLLCQPLPLPPDDIDITLPPLDPTLSTRERFARHSQDPACAGCHQLMDPVGLGFEHFDPVGSWRAEEAPGVPVDATGLLLGTPDGRLEGSFVGVPDLAARLAGAETVAACVARNLVRFAWAQDPTPASSGAVDRAAAALAASGGDLQELLLAVARDPAFLARAESQP